MVNSFSQLSHMHLKRGEVKSLPLSDFIVSSSECEGVFRKEMSRDEETFDVSYM